MLPLNYLLPLQCNHLKDIDMNTPTEEQKKRNAHIHALKAALDKAKQTGEPLKLKIGRFDAVYQNGKIHLK